MELTLHTDTLEVQVVQVRENKNMHDSTISWKRKGKPSLTNLLKIVKSKLVSKMI